MKKIYLTIDDGPSSFMRDKIDYLYKKAIPALWYCRGEYINEKTMPSLVHAIKYGFIVGNHSFTHPYFSTLTFAQAKAEILHTEKLIENAYALANVPQEHKIFRFPFLDKGGVLREQLQDFLRSEGFEHACFENITYQYYQQNNLGKDIDAPWTFDASEYALFSQKSMQKYKLFETNDFILRIHSNNPEDGFGLLYQHSNDIVLLHDFEQTNHLFIPIIETLTNLPIKYEIAKFEKI